MARYFVTGATGFIGSELARQLISRGHQVVALVRNPARASFLHTLGAEVFAGDITRPDTLTAPMQGVNGVFHVAAHYQLGTPDPAFAAANVDGTRHVLDTMRALGIARGVYTSSVVVHGDTRGALVDETHVGAGPFYSEYQRTKWQAHYELALPAVAAGLPLIIAMPGAVYGPGDRSGVGRTLLRLLAGRLVAVPSGTAFSWGYCEDTARGLIECMEKGRPGESYLLTGPTHSFEEFIDTAARLSDRRPPLLRIRPAVTRTIAAAIRGLEAVGVHGPLSAEGLRMLAGRTWIGSNEKAVRELGFAPRPIDEGLRPTIEFELRTMGKR